LDDDIVYIYSSGSTGRPKCAPRTVVQYWWEMDDVVTCLKLGRSDTIFGVIPLFHNFGAVQCMLASVGSGARLVMFKNPNPFVLRRQSALALLEKERVTIFPGVPFIFEHLVECTKSADLSSIRVCYSAAAALSQETADAFLAKYDIPIRDHYGCTEVGAMTIDLDPIPRQHGRSVGKPFPGVQVLILDEDGEPLGPKEQGEVVVRSRAMTRGYLGLDELNQQAFREGRFYTGDLGCLDEEGRLFLLGRKKFIIDVVGHKVDPYEVEDALAEHTNVRDSVVIGAPNENGDGTIVKAYVVADPICDERELIAFCRARLANFKVPQAVEFVSEIPKNTLGKVIRKSEVLEQYVYRNSTDSRVGSL
jgi:long-chain acyl-CoA synthetase